MKTPAILLAALGLTLGSLHAQTVPLFINYQGRITEGSGVPLGSTGTAPNLTAAPINRKIIFRIFDAQSAGTRLWSEQQTVTIALGEFSVLLGQGIDAVYAGTTETRPALDTVFNGLIPPDTSNRYLEIVVDDGSGTFTAADVPITPRQRITSTAYSLRARMADTVSPLAINAGALATGSVTGIKIVDGAITTDKIANLGILNGNIANSAVTTDKIADGTVGNADLANNVVTAAKLDPAIGVWTATGGNVSRLTGNVGIGKQPAVALDVAGAIAATGNITAAGSITATGAVTAGSITTTGPFSATNITADGAMRARGGSPGGGGVNNNGFAFTGGGGDNDSGMFSSGDGQLDFYTNSQWRMRIDPSGRVGIGTASPEVPLDVAGNTRITMTDNGYQAGQGSWSTPGNPAYPLYTLVDSPTYAAQGGGGPEVYGMWGGNGSSGPNLLNGFTSRYSGSVAIRASGGYIASSMGIVVYSDQRIKRDARASVTASDLATIQQLQVTDYRMVDPAGDGMAWRKGFIAQEVEKVIPGAVTRSVEFVPDIFSVATALEWHAGANTLSLTLGKDHDLKVGDRVRLHVDGSRLDLNVSAVPSAREFVVENCDRAPGKVLVYGKQVNDFRTVDYDRIFTTSVGALQELKKEKDAEVKALHEENASLRDRLAALEANDKTRDAKLAAIETLLRSAGKPAARTVSLNAGE